MRSSCHPLEWLTTLGTTPTSSKLLTFSSSMSWQDTQSSDCQHLVSFHDFQESASFSISVTNCVFFPVHLFFQVLASTLLLPCCFAKSRCIRHFFASTRLKQHEPAISFFVPRVICEGKYIDIFRKMEQIILSWSFSLFSKYLSIFLLSVRFVDVQPTEGSRLTPPSGTPQEADPLVGQARRIPSGGSNSLLRKHSWHCSMKPTLRCKPVPGCSEQLLSDGHSIFLVVSHSNATPASRCLERRNSHSESQTKTSQNTTTSKINPVTLGTKASTHTPAPHQSSQ